MPFRKPAFWQHGGYTEKPHKGLQSGFPFEDTARDTTFRTQLDDIAKRHPEFAQHLQHTWGPKRRGSEGATGTRFSETPFRRRFEDRFGDPFSRSFDEPQQQQHPQQPPSGGEKPPAGSSERSRPRAPHADPSSGVDTQPGLQEEEEEDRGQRSMSAPPENRNGQRFTSSVNIPMNMDPNQQQERVIPILVEGRDVPVTPKGPPPQQQTQPPPQPPPQPQQQRQQPPPPPPEQNWHQQPQPERMFGGAPRFGHNWNRNDFFPEASQFFQNEPTDYFHTPSYFINRGQQNRQPPQHGFQKAQAPPQQHQQPKQQPAPPQQHQPPPQQHQQPPPPPQQQQQQRQAPPTQPHAPPPQRPSGPLTSMEQIEWTNKEIQWLMIEIEKFNGKPKDKQYLYLDEMLTRNLLKLDNVETEGKENIRQARRDSIKCIQKCISILETKAKANELLYSDKGDVEVLQALNPGAQQGQREPTPEVAEAAAAEPMETEAQPQTTESQSDQSESVERKADVEDVNMENVAAQAADIANEQQPDDTLCADTGNGAQPPAEHTPQAETTPNEGQTADATKDESKEKKDKKKVKKKVEKK